MKSMCKLIEHGRGYPSTNVCTQPQRRVPPVPTADQLVATDYSSLLPPGVLPAPYEMHGSREHREEHACRLGCCQSDDSRACSEKKK